jgi:excinuclease ABC subunit B
MEHAIGETRRRRRIQESYNQKHHIVPATIEKSLASAFGQQPNKAEAQQASGHVSEEISSYVSDKQLEKQIKALESKMRKAADNLEFEKAAKYRDRVNTLKKMMVFDFEAAV